MDKLKQGAERTYRLFIISVKKFYSDLCLERATALAYKTFLSLIPSLVIMFVIYNVFSKEQLIEFLTDIFNQYLVPSSAASVIEFITLQIEVVSQAAASITIIGLFLFIFTGISLLNSIERVFNDIYRVKRSRSYLSKIQSYWAIISLGPLLLYLSITLSSSLKDYWFIESLRHYHVFAWILAYGPPFFLLWTAFLLLFEAMPYTRIAFKSAALGALVTAVLWSLVKVLFGWYFSTVVPQNKFYGSLGAVPFFLLWVYINWIVVLYGLEVSFSHQFANTLLGRQSFEGFRPFEYIYSMFLKVFLTIADDFRQNSQKATPGELGKKLGVPESEMHYILYRLKKHGLIHTTGDAEELYKPSRPLDQIHVNDIIESAMSTGKKPRKEKLQPYDDQITEMMEKVRESVRTSSGSVSVADLLQEQNKAPRIKQSVD